MLPGHVAKTTLHSIADDRVAHCLADHEAHSRSTHGGAHWAVLVRQVEQVDHQRACSCPPAPACRGAERRGVPQPVGRGQHEGWLAWLDPAVRRPGSGGPCDGVPRGCCGRRGCACAGGSRAPCDDDGCSAGKYACSRVSLHGVSGEANAGGSAMPLQPQCRLQPKSLSAGTAHPRIADCSRGHAAPVDTGRPPNGTRWLSTGSNPRPTGRRQPVDDILPGARRACYVQALRGSPTPAEIPSWTVTVTATTWLVKQPLTCKNVALERTRCCSERSLSTARGPGTHLVDKPVDNNRGRSARQNHCRAGHGQPTWAT